MTHTEFALLVALWAVGTPALIIGVQEFYIRRNRRTSVRMGPLLVNDPATGDAYYTGDLNAGIDLAERHMTFRHTINDDGLHVVRGYFSGGPDRPEAFDTWGAGATAEEAWRYVLGAEFGPLDEEYDEDRLRAALNEKEDR